MLTKVEMRNILAKWYRFWNEHNLEGVMSLFHEDVIFESWSGAKVKGKKALFIAWKPWFENHENFQFIEDETFIDEEKYNSSKNE